MYTVFQFSELAELQASRPEDAQHVPLFSLLYMVKELLIS